MYILYLGKRLKTAIKRGIKHWKRKLKGCLKFVRLDKSPEIERKVRIEKFRGAQPDHIEFSIEKPG